MVAESERAEPELAGLSDEDRQWLESWLVAFDQGWEDDCLGAWVRKLPPPGDGRRRPALVELVKIDMERRWRRGRRPRVESYLKVLPELGSPETVTPGLIVAEYEVRLQFGAPAAPEELAKRFPRQYRQVEARLGLGGQGGTMPQQVGPSPTPATPGPSGSAPVDLPHDLGRYQIVQRLGQGGMGSVYLARDSQLGRMVALKIPRFDGDFAPELLKRFYREARAAATIEHPNLCRVYDVGSVAETHFLTMEYIEGKPMSELLTKDKPLTSRQVASFVRKLALALQEVHRKGVIHRDLKPANIMINRRREPVIVDFGLARLCGNEESRLTRHGALMGTPAYMPPEQIEGTLGESCPGCDVYSLGVIIYELLAGRLPFRGSAMEVLAKILTQEPEAPSVYRHDIDPRLEAVCLKAMAKKREDRYGSMEELAEALGGYLATAVKPPETGSPGAPETSPKPAAEPGERPPINRVFAKLDPAEELARLLPPTPAPAGTGARPPSRRILAMAMACVAPILLLLGVIIYRVSTDKGQLVIETDDPDIEVVVSRGGEVVTVVDPKTDRKVEIRSGEYRVELKGDADGLRLSTDRFTLTRGKKQVVTIRREVEGVEVPGPLRVNPSPRRLQGSDMDRAPRVAMDAEGNSVVVWLTDIDAGDDGQHYVSLYDAAGRPRRDPFPVGPPRARHAAVAMDDRGGFVVAWDATGDDSPSDIHARRFDAGGDPAGQEYLVNDTIPGYQFVSSVAMSPSGEFVITWYSSPDGGGGDVYAKRFGADGQALGAEFRVNAIAEGGQNPGGIAMDAHGNFVIAWFTWDGGKEWDVRACRYDAHGMARGGELVVTSSAIPRRLKMWPQSVAMDRAGNFVVVWTDEGRDFDGAGVFARRFDAQGIKQGTDFRVNATTDKVQTAPAIAMDDEGGFIITWSSDGEDGDDFGVYAQRYDAAGTTVGPNFRVNATTKGRQADSAVAMNSDGDFVIAWMGNGPGDLNGVYLRRFAGTGPDARDASPNDGVSRGSTPASAPVPR